MLPLSDFNLTFLFTGAYESDSFKGSNDNIASSIGTAISGFQNQGLAAFNSFAGQANGVANNIGSAGSKPTSSAQTQIVSDEEQESAGASENVISPNLVEAQPPPLPEQHAAEQSAPVQQQQQQQPQPQQNEVHEEYLPPNH